LIPLRCKSCGKLLGWFDGKGEIKCPRSGCGFKNQFDTAKEEHKSNSKQNYADLKKRETSSGVTHW
jgi:phage FluMu protein Com